jgi:hypothetical protein
MSDQIQKLQDLATEELGMTPQKPLVMLPGKDSTMSETAENLYRAAAAQGGLYNHKRMVSKLDRPDGKTAQMVALTAATARTEFEKFVRFGRKTKTGTSADVLSESDSKALLSSDVATEILPTVNGVLRRPIPVLRDGKIELLKKGYNAGSGFLVEDGSIVESDTLEEAVGYIVALVDGFNFQTDSDKARAISAILTPALKMGGFITGNTPIDVVEASESQTGKTYFLRLRSIVYGEEPNVLAEQKGGVGSTDERIAAVLLEGSPFVILDNFRGSLDSQLLETYMTNRGRLGVRVPYAGLKYVDGSNLSISISSNGMTMTEDLANRSSFIRLNKDAGGDFIQIDGMYIDEFAAKFQKHLIGAITKVIRHYHEEKMPKTAEKRHSFRDWAQSLDWIVQNVFRLPPLIDGNMEIQKRAQNPSLAFVRSLAIAIEKAGRLEEHFRARELSNFCDGLGLVIPGVNYEAGKDENDDSHGRQIGKIMADVFVRDSEVTLDQFKVGRERASFMNNSGNWDKGFRYTFTRIIKEVAEALTDIGKIEPPTTEPS